MKIATTLFIGLVSLFICQPGKTLVGPVLQADIARASKLGSTKQAPVQNNYAILQDIKNFLAWNSTFDDAEAPVHNSGSDILLEAAAASPAPQRPLRFDTEATRGGNPRPNWKKQLAVYGYN